MDDFLIPKHRRSGQTTSLFVFNKNLLIRRLAEILLMKPRIPRKKKKEVKRILKDWNL